MRQLIDSGKPLQKFLEDICKLYIPILVVAQHKVSSKAGYRSYLYACLKQIDSIMLQLWIQIEFKHEIQYQHLGYFSLTSNLDSNLTILNHLGSL